MASSNVSYAKAAPKKQGMMSKLFGGFAKKIKDASAAPYMVYK